MSDREIIIKLLRTVEWRIRANRLLNELALALSVLLGVLIVFKIWDLFSAFQAATVTVVVGLCVALFAAYAAWRIRHRGTLDQAAVLIDQKAGLNDEIKTAFWFLNNPRSSEWVEKQIQRAASSARNVNVNRAYPNRLPRTSYIVAATILLFAGLNFMPLPVNHNWLMLQAASPDNGTAARADAAFDRDAVLKDLKEIAARLRESELLQETADALAKGDVQGAADDLRNLAQEIGKATPAQIEEFRAALAAAAASTKKAELEPALQEMADTSDTAEDDGIYEELQETAVALEELAQKLQTPVPSGTQFQTGKETDKSQSDESVRVPESGPPSGMKQSNTSGPGGSNAPPGGLGQLPTSLESRLQIDVKLQAQAVLAMGADKDRAPEKDEEEISKESKREHSTIDYRNVKSDLTPAQKDLLNQDHVPWEYRALIKGYFQGIRPPVKK